MARVIILRESKVVKLYLGIEEINLDLQNPRLIYNDNAKNENDIIDYLIKYNNDFPDLLRSIVENGFIQIGERLIVLEDGKGSYTVIEGNRRLSCLKLIHGIYSTDNNKIKDILKYTSQLDDLVERTQRIDVDIVENRNEARKIMAMRHIAGIDKWDLEAKLYFYGESFEDGLTLSEILDMTVEGRKAVTTALKHYLYLNEIKRITGKREIREPSFIYGRMNMLFDKLGIKIVVELTDTYKKSLVKLDSPYEEYELIQIIKELVDAYINKDIHSRYPYLEKDTDTVLLDLKLREKYPSLKAFKQKNKTIHQKKHIIFQGTKIKISDFLDLPEEFTKEEYRIYDSNNDIFSEKNFYKQGKFLIKINNQSFPISVEPLKPIVIQYDKDAKKFVNNTIHLEKIISISGVYGENVALDNPGVSVSCLNASGEEQNISDKKLLLSSPGRYRLMCSYKDMKHDKEQSEQIFSLEVTESPVKYTRSPNKDSQLFSRSFNTPLGGKTSNQLMEQIDKAYKSELFFVVASSLRSLVEWRLFEFFEECKNSSYQLFFNTSFKLNGSKGILTDIKSWDAEKDDEGSVINKKIVDLSNAQNISYQEIYNKIQGSLSEADIKKMEAILHLGAHKSLLRIDEVQLESIFPTVNFLLEFIDMLSLVL